MFTTNAYYSSVDAAAAWTTLAGVADPHVFVSGNDIRVPKLNKLIMAAFGVGSGGQGQGRLTSPSLRAEVRPIIEPVMGRNDGHVLPSSPQKLYDCRQSPISLLTDEALNAEIHSDTTAAARQWAIISLADGPVDPVKGEIWSVRATGATTLIAGSWVNVPITFDETLPVGDYTLVGLRARSTNLLAARAVLIDQGPRPGVVGCNAMDDLSHPMMRRGELGAFGKFHSTTPPSFDCLAGVADTAEVFILDIIRA